VPGGSPAITAAVFRAVRTGNAFEETVERLLEGVKLGVYAPGDRLPPERELTRRLGISRITLREALRELAAAGYVETKRGRFGGTFILRQPEPMVHDELTRTARDMGAQLDDALTYRRVVETGAAEMAARASLSMQQRESLAECLAAMYVCGPSGYRPADTRLHLAIADAAGPGCSWSTCSTPSPCSAATWSTRTSSTRASSGPSWPAIPTGPGARWKSTWPGPRRCSAASSVKRRNSRVAGG
jgi:DNA-binding FadR family transcriptional regulator